MEIKEQYKEDIPQYALPYLINGDCSGINTEDQLNIDKWFGSLQKQYNSHHIVIDPLDLTSFEPFPIFGLPCDTELCEITIF